MKMKRIDKRGELGIGLNLKLAQVTIFIIIAIAVVAIILVFFLWIQPTYISGRGGRVGLEGCVDVAIENAVKELGKKGGFIEPEFTYLYSGEEIPYLCYTNLYYESCVNQQPLLISNFKKELLKSVGEGVYSCLDSSLGDLESQGYSVVSGQRSLDIELVDGLVVVHLTAPVVLERESAQQFTEFEISVNSPIYEMLSIATSIVQFETSYGDSDVLTFMQFYPDYRIDKIKQSEGTTIYIIEDKVSGTKFQFASRSYAWPPGYVSESRLMR